MAVLRGATLLLLSSTLALMACQGPDGEPSSPNGADGVDGADGAADVRDAASRPDSDEAIDADRAGEADAHDGRGSDAPSADDGDARDAADDAAVAPPTDAVLNADAPLDTEPALDADGRDADDAAPRADADAEPSPDAAEDTISGPGDHGFVFRRHEIEAFEGEERLPHLTAAAAGDFDGDGATDLFTARTPFAGLPAGPACLFLNRSTPTEIAFDTPAICVEITVAGVAALDLDGDGRDELLTHTPGSDEGAALRTWTLDEASAALVELVEPAVVTGEACPSMIPYDVGFDGRIDLLLACIEESRVLTWTESGWRAFDEEFPPFEGRAQTFGLGIIDVDDDGLLDLFRINDTGSYPGRRFTVHPPGGAYLACVPGSEGCASFSPDAWRFGTDELAWGSYMGLAVPHVDGLGEIFYLADIGPNRALTFDEAGTPTDHAEALGIELGSVVDGRWIFSWSVVSHDFDGDGDDDLFVVNATQPEAIDRRPEEFAWGDHQDVVLLQDDGGFRTVSEEVGLIPHADNDDRPRSHPYAPRAALKLDLDGDGHFEIAQFSQGGRPRIYTVDTGPRRGCSIRPVPRYVLAHGYGYAVQRPDTPDVWRRRDVQGHYLGLSPDIVFTVETAGRIRFPSGWSAPFACSAEDGYAVVVEEPAWIDVSVDEGGRLRVSLELPDERTPDEVTARVRSAAGEIRSVRLERAADGAWTAAAAGDAEAVFLRVDARWIGRWIPVGDSG